MLALWEQVRGLVTCKPQEGDVLILNTGLFSPEVHQQPCFRVCAADGAYQTM